MKYSEKKFAVFTKQKKIKVIRDLIREIEQNWNSANLRTDLILQLQKLYRMMVRLIVYALE